MLYAFWNYLYLNFSFTTVGYNFGLVNARLCTHLVLFSFFNVTKYYHTRLHSKIGKQSDDYDKLQHKLCKIADHNTFMSELRAIKEKGVKVIAEVGHDFWLNPEQFSLMARNQDSRAAYVESISGIIEIYGLDGHIPNWRFPACPNVSSIHQFTIVIKFSTINYLFLHQLLTERRVREKVCR
jgi:GH18 family chitinase